MANTPKHAITLADTPTPRPRGMLLDVATDLNGRLFIDRGADRMGNGATWRPYGPIVISGAAQVCDTVYTKDPRELQAMAEQPAFLLWDSLICSTLGGQFDILNAQVRGHLNNFISAKITDELVTATLSGGLGLKGNGTTYVPTVVTATAVSLVVALSNLQDSLNAKQAGARFTILVTPGLLDLGAAYGLFVRVGDHFETAGTGHLVVGDAGFTGRGLQQPPGHATAGTNEAWIFATGEIFYRTGPIKPEQPTDASQTGNAEVYVLQNKDRPLAERTGLVLFDPTLLAAAKVTLAAL